MKNVNLAWLLIAGFLVMFMQVGFAMVETGFTRAKNAVHTMAMNFVIYPLGVVGFWLVGYGFMFGGLPGWPSLSSSTVGAHEVGVRLGGHFWGLLGLSKFGLVTVAQDPANLAMFFFAAVFMDTAATIPTGALAERWKFSSFLLYGGFMSVILYPLFGNWVWGGGWLAGLGRLGWGHGHVDFAGSSVVHMTGGVTALVGSRVVGPRLGKFRRDGSVSAIPGHNLPLAMLGTLILAFGWFAFNAGSTLSLEDRRIALIAVNTLLASASGSLAALVAVWQTMRRPDMGMACNGLLGGLVAITASCAFVSPSAAVLTGLVAGLLVVAGTHFLERRLRIDDPVGAISVHGVCGLWGCLALGLFADGTYGEGWNGVRGPVRGLFFGDGWQLVAELVGVVVNLVVVGGLALAFFALTHRLLGHRVTQEAELAGLDSSEMGSAAYPPG